MKIGDQPALSSETSASLAELLKKSRRLFLFSFFLTAVTQLLTLAPVIYVMNLFDRVMTSRSVVTLISLTLILIAANVFANSVGWLRSRLMARFAISLDWQISADVFDAAFRRFATNQRINVQQVMNDLTSVRNFFMGQGLPTLLEVPYALLFALISFLIHPWLCLFALANVVLMVILAALKVRAVTPLVRQANQVAAETNRAVAEVLRHADTAMALGMQATLRQKWFRRHQSDLLLSANGHEASGMIGSLSALADQMMPRLAMGLAVFLVISGEISPGMSIGAMFLIRMTMRPMQVFIRQWPSLANTKLSLERLEALLSKDQSTHDRMPLPAPIGQLDVQNLTVLSRNGKRKILDNITFSLRPGELLAVVGPSAAGKSFLLRHLAGILKPTSGSVRLDGVELNDWIHSLDVPNLGFVPQDMAVFEGTVAENIARLEEIVPQAVVKAAELIDFHKTILSFPNGYETQLAEDDFALTGGQKQRLMIARALYGEPKLIVMDEPSSALDVESEEAFVRLLLTLRQNKVTVVVTTHRPNLVAASDYVLVLKKGTQEQFGSTDEIGESVINGMTAQFHDSMPLERKKMLNRKGMQRALPEKTLLPTTTVATDTQVQDIKA